MNIIFNIEYFTTPGQAVALEIVNNTPGGYPMNPTGNGNWTLSLEVENTTRYRYIITNVNGETLRVEWGHPHVTPHINGTDKGSPVVVYDRWQDIPPCKPFYSQAFTKSIFKRIKGSYKEDILTPGSIMFNTGAPLVASEHTVVITGSCEFLGNWDPRLAPELNDIEFPIWSITIPLDKLPASFEYKMVVVDKTTREVIQWEEGENRSFSIDNRSRDCSIAVNGLMFSAPKPSWRGAGVTIPVFSLRSTEDCGIGDFYDLKLIIDWAHETGQCFVQILPINDTTMTGSWTDSYPYNANSTFALHPMYLRLEAIGVLKDENRREYYKNEALRLNALKEVDYELVNKVKTGYMHEIFEQNGSIDLSSAEFNRFYELNADWLRPYAAFCVLRDMYHTADFNCWEKYSVYVQDVVELFIAEHIDAINFVYFQQYHLDRQLSHVRDYARKQGIAIKGDIPIGISRTSVDAWVSPRLFNLSASAGAPPDDFAVLGQNWGFPTYNWDEMSLDGYAWWKARFAKMAEYFDAYRIDHVLGFFRIWEVPFDQVHGLLGTFNPALPMSPSEMWDNFGFVFDKELFTTPYITEDMLRPLFGEFTDEVRSTCLEVITPGRYRLRPQFKSQKQVQHFFYSIDDTPRLHTIVEGLMTLIDNVLFIEDPYHPGLYHPRISGKDTTIYKVLDEKSQATFDALYEYFYYHRHNHFWYESAMRKLPALIESTHMLTCAEDLGMIPACVPQVMSELEILTLEIQRMPKEFVRFGNPAKYPYYSVCTTSTHDMSGIRGWWEENRDTTVAYYRDILQMPGDAPYFAEPRICKGIIEDHLASPAMLCILPLQDWLSVDGKLRRDNPNEERINVPANSHQYWRYRMHLTLEELLVADDFNATVHKMIADNR